MKSTFARRISILLVLAMVLAMLPLGAMAATPDTLYLKPNSNWKEANARFAAYFFGNGETWVSMTDADADGIYEVAVPAGYPNVIFCRMSPSAAANNWKNKWNQTADLTVPTDGTNCYTVKEDTWDKGGGTWSKLDVSTGEEETTEATTEAPKLHDYYVAGTFTNWNECNEDYGMDLVDGVYTLTVTLAAGTHMFKVTDGTWNNSWGKDGGKGDYEFVLTEEAVVTFTFDPTTKIPACDSAALGEVETFDYYLVGDMNGWSVSSNGGMKKNDDGTYSITLNLIADTYEYKVNNGAWSDDGGFEFPAQGNQSVTVETDCAVTFTYDPTAQTLTATGDGIAEEPEVVIESVNVMGTIPGLSWDEATDVSAMTLVDGIYTITLPDIPASEIGASAYAFKVYVNGSSDLAYPENDWTFYLTEECDVTITYNPADNVVTLDAEFLTYDAPTEGGEGEDPVDPPVVEKNYYVAGTMNGWAANAEGYGMTDNGDGTYSLTITLTAGNHSLKVTDGTWDNSWTAAEGSEYLAGDGNLSFYVSADSEVTVTFDGSVVTVSGSKVTAKVPEALVVDKVVIAGGLPKDSTDDLGEMFNGLTWAVGAEITVNNLYDNEDGIYEITFNRVMAGTYEFKFVINDNWGINYATGLQVTPGTEETAWFDAKGNSTVVVTEDGSTVTFILDLSNVVYVGDNAKMTVNVEVPASIKEDAAPEQIVVGKNEFAVATGNQNPVTATYTATYTGTLYIYPTAMTVVDNWSGMLQEVPAEAINMQFGRMRSILVNGAPLWGNAVEVVEGETYEIGIMDATGSGCLVTLTVCTGHNFVDGACSVCGYVCANHNWDNGTCLICGATCNHETWDDGWCTNCWMQCEHSWTYSHSKNDSHTFTCSGLCGQTITIDDTDGKKFAINSAAPVLSDDIVLKYRCTIPAGFEYPYIVFEFNGEEYYVSEYEVESDGRYSFKFPYVLPQKMADNICATLYAEVNGTQVSVQIAKYSMLQYCFNTLKKPTASKIDRTLYSDVLAYGAAVQVAMNYKTDALVTDLAAAMLAEESAKNEGKEGYPVVQTPSTFPGLDDSYNLQARYGDATFTGAVPTSATIVLGAKVKLRISITCTDLEAYSYKLTLNGREYSYTGADLTPVNDGSDGKYYLYFEGIKAMELCEVMTMTIWEGDTQVGYTLEYSVGTYIYKNVDKANTSEANRNLMKALFNYGESTKAAFEAGV